MIANQEQFDRLVKERIWTSSDKRELLMSELHENHLNNIIRRLQKNVKLHADGMRRAVLDWPESDDKHAAKVIEIVSEEVLRRFNIQVEVEVKNAVQSEPILSAM